MAMLLSAGCLLLLPVGAVAPDDKPAYRWFTGDGEPTTWRALCSASVEADVVLFGEVHSNPVCHWLELELARELHAAHGERLMLAAEMFETDDQLVLDEYLRGTIRSQDLEREAKVWTNYATDYRPLLEFARDRQLRMIASNIPRRYANLVARTGVAALEELPPEARSLMPPLPIEIDLTLPGYRAIMDTTQSHPNGSMTPERMAQAQAVKDATMAWSLLRHLGTDGHALHLNGAYHSAYFEGIIWYLRRSRPDLKLVSLGTVEQKDLTTLEPDSHGYADFVLVTPVNLTTTH